MFLLTRVYRPMKFRHEVQSFSAACWSLQPAPVALALTPTLWAL
jgi:hypothetical protein